MWVLITPNLECNSEVVLSLVLQCIISYRITDWPWLWIMNNHALSQETMMVLSWMVTTQINKVVCVYDAVCSILYSSRGTFIVWPGRTLKQSSNTWKKTIVQQMWCLVLHIYKTNWSGYPEKTESDPRRRVSSHMQFSDKGTIERWLFDLVGSTFLFWQWQE